MRAYFPLLGFWVPLVIGCSDDAGSADGGPNLDASASDGAHRDGWILDGTVSDASLDASIGQPVIGPFHDMALLDSTDPSRPYNQAAGVSVAAWQDHVVVAFGNLHYDSAQGFQAADFAQKVGLSVSHDGGGTWEQTQDPGLGENTSNPVLGVGSEGTFFLSVWDRGTGTRGRVGVSRDQGDTWEVLVPSVGFGGFEWFAVDSDRRLLWLAGQTGMWLYSWSGDVQAYVDQGGIMVGAYVDGSGGHFANLEPDSLSMLFWPGTGLPEREGAALPTGQLDGEVNSAAAVGRTRDGGQWIVRAVRSSGQGQVVCRVRHLPDEEGQDVILSDPNAVAFLPAAVADESGRLHVIWYESSPGAGVLKYARSLTSDFSEGFSDPVVVDDTAVPVGGWYPTSDRDSGGLRLGPHSGIAVLGGGDRVVVAWTHAPEPPSRVTVATIEFR